MVPWGNVSSAENRAISDTAASMLGISRESGCNPTNSRSRSGALLSIASITICFPRGAWGARCGDTSYARPCSPPGKVSYLCLPSLDQDNRKVLGAMGPQDQNSLDVAGPTRARDERDKTGVISNVPFREKVKGRRKIRHELIGSGDDQVMRRAG